MEAEALPFLGDTGFLDPRPSAAIIDERLRVEGDVQDRMDQAVLAFGAGTAGTHVSREALRTFRALLERHVRRQVERNGLAGRWHHMLSVFRAWGQQAAFGRSVVKGEDVTYAWSSVKHREHGGEGGQTDFCSEAD